MILTGWPRNEYRESEESENEKRVIRGGGRGGLRRWKARGKEEPHKKRNETKERGQGGEKEKRGGESDRGREDPWEVS